MDSLSIHLWSLGAACAAFACLWPLSVARRDASVVDGLWGPGFAVIAWGVWFAVGAPQEPRSLILLALVTAWSVRLGAYMIARKRREPEEDPRYTDLRRSWDPGFWWKSLFVVFLLQGFLQWLMTLGVQRAMLNPVETFGPIAVFGVVAALVGLSLETVADAQLAAFRRRRGRGVICDEGLWAWCRHPNYLGEMVFWWGVWFVAWPAAEIWTVIAPITLTALLRWVSGVPMLEAHLSRTKSGYASYRARTPMFAPRRPAKAAASAS